MKRIKNLQLSIQNLRNSLWAKVVSVGSKISQKYLAFMLIIINLFIPILCYSRDIVTSIKNLEQKHVFRALLEDSVSNVTVDNPEIDRWVETHSAWACSTPIVSTCSVWEMFIINYPAGCI